jgi:hypothetical protein
MLWNEDSTPVSARYSVSATLCQRTGLHKVPFYAPGPQLMDEAGFHHFESPTAERIVRARRQEPQEAMFPRTLLRKHAKIRGRIRHFG